MRIDSVIRKVRGGTFYVLIPQATARLIAQAWGIPLGELHGRGVAIELEV